MTTQGTAPRFGAEMKATLRLALPLALAQASVMLMGVVDTAVVGRHSPLELGAVSLGNALTYGTLVFGMGFAMALEPLVAQALGAADRRRAWGWWRVGLQVAAVAGVPLTAVTLLLSQITPAFGVEADLAERATAYLMARAPAMLLYLPYMAARSVLQSHQRTLSLVIAAAVANVFNLLANVLLVNGDRGLVALGLPALGLPELGGVGAGVATSVSTGVMLVIMLRDLRRYRPAEGGERPRDGRRRLLRLGLPLGLQLAAEFVVFSAVGVMAATIDAVAAGAHQIALHCTTMAFMAVIGVGGATSARVGHAVGRGGGPAVRGAALAGLTVGLIIMATSALAFVTVPGALAGLFAPDEPAVLALATELLAIGGFFQLFDGIQVVIAGALRGAGDVRRPFLITLACHWGVGFPTAALLAFTAGLGAHGLWYGLTAGLAIVSAALAWRFVALTRRPLARVD
ncbi:MAG: MATE family efflux transporter [Proteobacteria bacterium]|nr:MAG: MATE family efflux transporter [Pseudomonadota bacterium]